MQTFPKIGIVYLSFHSDRHLPDFVSALKNMSYPKDRAVVYIVDNPHPEYGNSMRTIDEIVMPFSGKEVPVVRVFPQSENTGFDKGNNIGAKAALQDGCDYVFFHNDDGFFGHDCLQKMVEAMEADESIGLAQALILLHPDTHLVNTSGNAFHYLGLGYCNNYRTPVNQLTLSPVSSISYASGAALMARSSLVKQYGAWDEDFFIYHEDIEWTFRLRVLGYKTVLVRDALFYHKYQFSRSILKYFWMERNRYGFMLMYFRWPTLLLLLPMALVLEFGQLIFAWRGGWLSEKKKVYAYWFQWEHVNLWLQKRRKIQNMRQVSDRFLLSFAVSGIHFQEKSMEHPLLLYMGNPIMRLYYYIVVKGLIWW